MLITIFGILIFAFLALVFIGFFTEVSAISTIGFFLLFLLSFTLINNNLEYQSGYQESWMKDVRCCSNITNYAYDTNTVTFSYTSVSDTRSMGIYLAVGSAVGMILVLISGTDWGKKITGRITG